MRQLGEQRQRRLDTDARRRRHCRNTLLSTRSCSIVQDIAGDNVARRVEPTGELVDDRVDTAFTIDQAQDLDGLLIRQQQPLGSEDDPRLASFVETEPHMRCKAEDGGYPR